METGPEILLIVGGVINIVLAPISAFFGSSVAEMKGRCKVPWLILCGLFFPMFILLCFLPAKESQESFSERYLSVIRDLGAIPLQRPLVVLRIPAI
jgi:Na+/melibiose symporter-like transporter